MVLCNITFRSALITENGNIVNMPIKKKKRLEKFWRAAAQ